MGFLGRIFPAINWLLGRHLEGQQQGIPQGLMGLGLAISATTGLAATASPVEALEEIQLTYGVLQSEPIPMAELEAFAFSGTPSRDLELLLDILDIDEDIAQTFLTQEIPIDFEQVRRVSGTFMGSIFWRLAGSAIALNDTTGEGWQHLRDALINAAEDDRITLLEVLQNIEAGLMVIDTQRVIELSSQLRQDGDGIQPFFPIFRDHNNSPDPDSAR
jgi:hypothetical protein